MIIMMMMMIIVVVAVVAIIIIMMLIALKGAIRYIFFFTISSLRRELSPTHTPK